MRCQYEELNMASDTRVRCTSNDTMEIHDVVLCSKHQRNYVSMSRKPLAQLKPGNISWIEWIWPAERGHPYSITARKDARGHGESSKQRGLSRAIIIKFGTDGEFHFAIHDDPIDPAAVFDKLC